MSMAIKAQLGKALTTLPAVLLLAVLVLWPVTAGADGGPAVDPALYGKLQEGQQVGVVTIKDLNTVSVDLFVSILDQTGESHEIVYFVPLGSNANGLTVYEEDSLSFGRALTDRLDATIFQYRQQSQEIVRLLYAGALMTNGAWLIPAWIPVLLSGCGSSPGTTALSTFTTESSQVSVFAIDDNTDLNALINTTGLDAAVVDTLSRLKGQQIAVIKLRTTPASSHPPSTSGTPAVGEPGLHLSWQTALTRSKSGVSYTYPLGTGAAWASPITLTRVYVVAPPEMHFQINYPKLGVNRSGMVVGAAGRYTPRILEAGDGAAYAIDVAKNEMTGEPRSYNVSRVNVWRATYTNSNSDRDITIAVKEGPSMSALGQRLRDAGPFNALWFGMLAAAILWILAWWLLMPRLLGKGSTFGDLLAPSLGFIGIGLLLFIPGAFFYFITSFANNHLEGLYITVPLFAIASLFILDRLAKLDVKGWRAIRSVALVTLASGGAYLLVAVGYAAVVGAI